MARGGYQRPSSPAPVSGPGALAQRTDGGPGSTQASRYISGLPYGEGQQMMNIQSSAPMEAAPAAPSPTATQISQATQQAQPASQGGNIVPLGAPTQRPDEPVTAGANAGPGPDMSVLNLQSPDVTNYQDTRSYIQALAQNSSASPALKFLAQRINGAF